VLAVVKTPHTEFRIEGGTIPEKLPAWLSDEYGDIEINGNDDWRDSFNPILYRIITKKNNNKTLFLPVRIFTWCHLKLKF
jgi:hypothetical protein